MKLAGWSFSPPCDHSRHLLKICSCVGRDVVETKSRSRSWSLEGILVEVTSSLNSHTCHFLLLLPVLVESDEFHSLCLGKGGPVTTREARGFSNAIAHSSP